MLEHIRNELVTMIFAELDRTQILMLRCYQSLHTKYTKHELTSLNTKQTFSAVDF